MAENSILSLLTNPDALKGISDASGVSAEEVTSVLANALPQLLNGANNQTKDESTVASFTQALEDHSKKDTSDLLGFFKNVDITDGGKIVQHLLGGGKEETANDIAKKSGIDVGKVLKIMAVAAPLIMTLVGNKAKAEKEQKNESSLASIASMLLGGNSKKVDTSDVLSILGKIIK